MLQRPKHGRYDASAVEARVSVVEKTGFAGPLIRPTGTFSPRGEEGIETLRHIPFASETEAFLTPTHIPHPA
ncbi:hypothetical protein B5P46_05475 [Rhizobium leguminosarum]|uniref:Uncharacterized protein n=1 Tax=Rhizobium leguminosarum TaxID=384 RepID=A0A4Q1U900_RHILE|nr:hypothetical protein B5P46_05475 [Rhizobium leguminosarum]